MHNDKDPASIAGNCRRILADSSNRVWCVTEKGVSLYNPKSGTFTNYTLNLPLSDAGDRANIRVITANKEGNLWLGGSFNGLFYLDTKTAVSTFYTHSNDPGSLPDFGGINSIFFDRSGTLWISVPWSGIACLDPRNSMFNSLAIKPSSDESNAGKVQDEFRIVGRAKDSIFYVKNTSGLFAWNYKKNSYKRIELGNDKVYRQINCVITANDGLIWIGSGGRGLICYNPVNKSVKNFRNNPKDSTSVSSDYINILKEDPKGNLWIGTGDKGLCRFIKANNTFFRYPFIENNGTIHAKNKLDDATVHSMLFDKEGILWIGTNLGGLNRLDTKTGKFTSFLELKSGLNCVINIFEDSQNRFWAGTYLSGLFLIDKKTGGKKRYSEKEGLLFNAVIGISEDKAGNIWLASARGLSRLNPENNSFTNFPASIGDSPSTNILYRGADGSFQVAKAGGLISFNPEKMNVSTVPPAVIIESVSYSDAYNKDTILFTYDRKKIELKYNENRISFQFVALHYANPELNQYAYRLEGIDKDWIQAGTQRSATYSNLSPGTFTFRVKAANSDGVWNQTGASFVIIILPPWWKTWWAYCLYGLLLLAGIFAVHRFQKQRTIRIEREKTQKRELAQAREIEKAYTELKSTQAQLIQSEKMASLGELTAGIAHEIQNPLNFVNNFSEVNTELIEEMKLEIENGNLDEVKSIADDIAENERKITQHGKRADAIVKGMLQHSRSSSGLKEPTNINAIADEYLRLAYHGLRAKDKSFNATLHTDFDRSIGKINAIPQDIGRVILNLITNAFYSVAEKKEQQPTGYEPTVSVSTKMENGNVVIKVKDNGNGIPQKVLDKIYQPFFTTKPTGQGTGLGLSMSYEIVTKAHGGELKVDTKEGEGSVFTVLLPV
jgi:signal transduction histidine kinase/streptogramin lyase